MPRSRTSGQHVQGWVDTSAMATVVQWLGERGQGPQSVSQLVGVVFEALAQIIVDNGGQIVTGQQAEEVLDTIGQRRSFGAMRTSTKNVPVVVSQQAVRMATTLFEKAAQGSNSNLPDGEGISEADEGDFSAEALRIQRSIPQGE